MTLPNAAAVPLDQVFTRHAFNTVGSREYKDQKYKDRPLLKLLDEKSIDGGGGQSIVHRINLGTTFNGKALPRNGTFSILGDSNETWSKYAWSTVIETCFVSFWDIREAGHSPEKMISILDSRIHETRENMEDNIVTMLSQSSAATADDINPLLSIVAPTGATGGLNPSTSGQSTWASQTEATITWSTEGIGRARELYTAITDCKGKPDVILLPQSFWLQTCEIGDAATNYQIDAKTKGGTKYADLGSTVPIILNLPVIHDPAWDTAQSGTGLMLDLSGVHIVVDPDYDMYMYPFKDMVHHGRLGQASVQIKVCQLTCSSRRTQGSMTTIS